MGLSFPYPQLGSTRRNPGQGCSSCVHKEYCQAFYWLIRYASKPSESGKNTDKIDNHVGIQCGSWSDDINDRVTTITQDDFNENYRLAVKEDILVEPFDSGISDPVTDSAR